MGFEGPTVVYDMGTSSDLIAVKEPGLGHVLVLIKFRSIPELVSLANNFGVPDQLLVFSAHFNTTTNILKSVHVSCSENILQSEKSDIFKMIHQNFEFIKHFVYRRLKKSL